MKFVYKKLKIYYICKQEVNMTNQEIFALRLRNARIMKGFSMDDLCLRMDNLVSKMTISKYEKCKLEPNSTIVIAIAKAMSLPFDYFFRPFMFKIDSIKFSKIGIISDKQQEVIRQNVSDLMERYITIEEICNDTIEYKKPVQQTVSDYEQIKEVA